MNVVVIGAQWGDEGKGKIVDYLADRSDVVVRFSGGANAGHTIVAGETTYKLHLVPSGIVYPNTLNILGSGMVIDVEELYKELTGLSEQGLEWHGRVFISERAHVVLPRHKQQDLEMDAKRATPIGTTGRGIGVAYAEKAHREGIRIAEITNPTQFAQLRKEDKDHLLPYVDKIREMSIDITAFMAQNKDKQVLFEGAQGILLDIDIGTYPFVSSGYSSAAGAAAGGGIGPRALDKVLGVCKAYSTRVGNGPFPSEFTAERDGDLEHTVRETGREYGVTTGRPRRCGYLDLVALKYACRANSIDFLVLTHIDVYDSMDKVQACVAYKHGETLIESFPASAKVLEESEPVTETFDGWNQSICDVEEYESLPEQTRNYIRFIEDYTETPIGIVSVGYRRDQTIIRQDPWIRS
ncbi:MAG: adenylosuccinate synthase [Spirochaetales bacterium]|nr:adenylosuccinate synthase [Spirochaetales bacterium]